jgi:hypothetical protein
MMLTRAEAELNHKGRIGRFDKGLARDKFGTPIDQK